MTVLRVLYKHQVESVVKHRKKFESFRFIVKIYREEGTIGYDENAKCCLSICSDRDCTCLKIIRIYSNKKAESTIHFLGEILNIFPFSVQRIQTDWETEFLNFIVLPCRIKFLT